uniref:CPW-WPC domain-containing protein n=1 Tax=viral metagenome TaxID=1070528 RepID=A0A6C0CHE6_9ZZZZ
MPCDFHYFLNRKTRMNSYDIFTTVIATALFTVILLAVYKYVLNPSMVIQTQINKCPDLWTYDGKMCVPQYETQCSAFDPDAPTLQTDAAKCNTAHTCGTSWSGYCP